MRALAAGLALLLLACAPQPAPAAKRWTAKELLAGAPAHKNFGGFDAATLAVPDGAPLPFRGPPYDAQPVLNAAGPALAVLPAFAAGQTASYAVSEIWQSQPDPWVEPVYLQVSAYDANNPTAARISGSHNVFPVGPKSSFYTPFWQLVVSELDAAAAGTGYQSASEVLRGAKSLHDGPTVLCPIVDGVGGLAVGAGEGVPLRPLSLLALHAAAGSQGWVDGALVNYLLLGLDRFTVLPQANVQEVPMYVFVQQAADGTRTPLPLPAVLSDDAFHESLARRHEVVLGGTMAVFVPAGLEDLRTALLAAGVSAPHPDAVPADFAREHLLRVTADGACFTAPGGPASCAWLDSQAALEAARATVVRTEVVLTVATLQLGALVLK